VVQLPLRRIRISFQAKEMQADIFRKKPGRPAEEDLAKELELQPEELDEILRTPLDTPLNSGGSIGEDFRTLNLVGTQATPGADEVLIQKTFRREIEEILRRLKPRERRVIDLRFGLSLEGPLTLEQIGRRMRLSRERVRQIEENAKRRLRIFAKSRRLQDFLN
jgi:RNA polymerase primary sigma factor